MATELVLDASVSLAWFLKETPERAAFAAAASLQAVLPVGRPEPSVLKLIGQSGDEHAGA